MKPNTHMNAVAYSGTGTLGRAVNGFGFMPDFAWIKQRSGTEDHKLTDSVRGVTKQLSSNNVNQEYNNTDQITAFTSDGFTTDNSGSTNGNSQTYIAWAWRASNTTAVANTAGTITSMVSANPTAGFSVVTWTGNGANALLVMVWARYRQDCDLNATKWKRDFKLDYLSCWNWAISNAFLNTTDSSKPTSWPLE